MKKQGANGEGRSARIEFSNPEKPSSATTVLFFSSLAPLPDPLSHTPFPFYSWSICGNVFKGLHSYLLWYCSVSYQKTSLTTAWGIQINPVNVFILKKRCTFNRKSCFSFACIFLQKGKKKHNGKKRSRVRACAFLCVLCQLTVDSLLLRYRENKPTPSATNGKFVTSSGTGGVGERGTSVCLCLLSGSIAPGMVSEK